MKLVVDNENVTHLEVRNLADIAAMARGFADDIDAGKWGEVNRVICIIENQDGINIAGWGECATVYEMMGIFEAAKLRQFAEDFCGDEE